jgi:hypothetical protein
MMLKQVAVMVALLCAPVLAYAQYTFAEMQWGISKAEARQKLTQAGFGGFLNDSDGDIAFKGKLQGEPAQGFAYFDGSKLVRVLMQATPPAGGHHALYGRLRGSLVSRYGEPDQDLARFLAPYRNGDGKEAEAFKAGKAVFSAKWTKPAAGSAFTWIGEDYVVGIDYESPAWPEVKKARDAKQK